MITVITGGQGSLIGAVFEEFENAIYSSSLESVKSMDSIVPDYSTSTDTPLLSMKGRSFLSKSEFQGNLSSDDYAYVEYRQSGKESYSIGIPRLSEDEVSFDNFCVQLGYEGALAMIETYGKDKVCICLVDKPKDIRFQRAISLESLTSSEASSFEQRWNEDDEDEQMFLEELKAIDPNIIQSARGVNLVSGTELSPEDIAESFVRATELFIKNGGPVIVSEPVKEQSSQLTFFDQITDDFSVDNTVSTRRTRSRVPTTSVLDTETKNEQIGLDSLFGEAMLPATMQAQLSFDRLYANPELLMTNPSEARDYQATRGALSKDGSLINLKHTDGSYLIPFSLWSDANITSLAMSAIESCPSLVHIERVPLTKVTVKEGDRNETSNMELPSYVKDHIITDSMDVIKTLRKNPALAYSFAQNDFISHQTMLDLMQDRDFAMRAIKGDVNNLLLIAKPGPTDSKHRIDMRKDIDVVASSLDIEDRYSSITNMNERDIARLRNDELIYRVNVISDVMRRWGTNAPDTVINQMGIYVCKKAHECGWGTEVIKDIVSRFEWAGSDKNKENALVELVSQDNALFDSIDMVTPKIAFAAAINGSDSARLLIERIMSDQDNVAQIENYRRVYNGEGKVVSNYDLRKDFIELFASNVGSVEKCNISWSQIGSIAKYAETFAKYPVLFDEIDKRELGANFIETYIKRVPEDFFKINWFAGKFGESNKAFVDGAVGYLVNMSSKGGGDYKRIFAIALEHGASADEMVRLGSAAVYGEPLALMDCPYQSVEMCKLACEKNPFMFKYVRPVEIGEKAYTEIGVEAISKEPVIASTLTGTLSDVFKKAVVEAVPEAKQYFSTVESTSLAIIDNIGIDTFSKQMKIHAPEIRNIVEELATPTGVSDESSRDDNWSKISNNTVYLNGIPREWISVNSDDIPFLTLPLSVMSNDKILWGSLYLSPKQILPCKKRDELNFTYEDKDCCNVRIGQADHERTIVAFAEGGKPKTIKFTHEELVKSFDDTLKVGKARIDRGYVKSKLDYVKAPLPKEIKRDVAKHINNHL